MDKRYQVFVSSTFRDLEDERQEVMHALLELDCIPSGMELFPAANDTQWDLIKRVIDDCDYYILIIAGRYGSLNSEGLSYTEAEYRYALERQKPTIAFLHRDPGKIIADNSETSPEGKAKLQAFRELAQQKLCKYWDSSQELGSVVSRSLIQLIKSTPAIGWVRANELASQDATKELLQLRRTVEDLRAELASARISAPKGSDELAQGDETLTLNFRFYSSNESQFTTSATNITWNRIFNAVAPLMIHEANEQTIRLGLSKLIQAHTQVNLSSRYGDISNLSINDDDVQTIKVQLRALGLIVKSDKARSVKDTDTYWTLTPHGDAVMTQLRAIHRNKPLG